MNLNNCLFQFSNYSNYFFESSFSLFIYITTYISIIYIILERELVPLFFNWKTGKLENRSQRTLTLPLRGQVSCLEVRVPLSALSHSPVAPAQQATH